MSAGSVGMTILTGGAGQAAGSLVGPAADAGKGIYTCLKRKYEYIKNLAQNFNILEIEAKYLSSREKDVNDKITRNKIMMDKTHECDTWLEDVRNMRNDLEDLKKRYQKAETLSCGPCQLRTCLKLSREIVKKTKSVIDLKDRMNLDHMILKERPVESIEKKFPMKKDVPTLRENVDRLLEFLKNDDIKKVGIWGMPGVGKTTILKNLNNELQDLQLFEIVLWVDASKDSDHHQIQHHIMNRLGLKVEGTNDESHSASLISKSLEHKRYLLVLDQVTSELDLHDIGINEGHVHGKVVVATRERTICTFMEPDEEIKVERLSRNDAHNLFREVVGDTIEYPVIKPIADLVLRQCGELPQVIRAVGLHLKGKRNEHIWRDTLLRLQSPSMDHREHMEEVFTAFRLICDELKGGLKNFLLYGSSFPEDYDIHRDYLVECCWMAGQKTDDIGQTLRKACDEGHSNVEALIDRGLFDQCKSMKYVKIPIIFRNAALRMARLQNFGILLKDDDDLENYPPVEKWRNAEIVSLMKSDLVELPENPECYRVSTLFLQKNENLSAMPASFFASMPTLKILDLYGTDIKFLPSSISELADLRGLYLNDCHQLAHLPEEIEKLQHLEVLDIRRTAIHGFPIVIRKLTSLQCLRVSFANDLSNHNHIECNGEDKFPSKTLELLVQLEELTIDADPYNPKWNNIAPQFAVQLAELRKLSALSFHFPTAELLETFTQNSIFWKNGASRIGNNFRAFNIVVGSSRTHNPPKFDISNCTGRRYLQYVSGKDTPSVIKKVLGFSCAFRLIGHQTIEHFSDLGIDKMEGLEFCEVKECHSISTIVASNVAETRVFPWLRELYLLNLQQLDCISRGPISIGSFARLTTLTVYECPKLSTVLTWNMAKHVAELQYLRVEKCSQVTEIIGVESSSSQISEICAFPKLKTLELLNLDRLNNIYAGNTDTVNWPVLQQIETIECENLASLCFTKKNATKLSTIRCSEAWWGRLSLDDESRVHFQAFCNFV